MKKKSSTSRHIPEEIREEILLRLPLNSLLRFKSVSKAWYTLITSPIFARSHLKHGAKPKIMLLDFGFLDSCSTLYSIDYNSTCGEADEIHLPSEYHGGTDNTCDGLFLAYGRYRDDLCVWNPSTHQCWDIPTADFNKDSNHDHFYLHYGLGFDSTTKDYKILRLRRPNYRDYPDEDDHRNSEFFLYTVSTNSWRRLNNIPYRRYSECFKYMDNALYFLAKRSCSLDNCKLIISFDLSTEEFKEILPPNYEFNIELLSSQSCLTVASYFHDPCAIQIWEYGGVTKSWNKICCIDLEMLKDFTTIYLAEKNEILLCGYRCEEDYWNGYLVFYDPKQNKAKFLSNCGERLMLRDAQPYVESLISLNAPKNIVNENEEEDDDCQVSRKRIVVSVFSPM